MDWRVRKFSKGWGPEQFLSVKKSISLHRPPIDKLAHFGISINHRTGKKFLIYGLLEQKPNRRTKSRGKIRRKICDEYSLRTFQTKPEIRPVNEHGPKNSIDRLVNEHGLTNEPRAYQ